LYVETSGIAWSGTGEGSPLQLYGGYCRYTGHAEERKEQDRNNFIHMAFIPEDACDGIIAAL
jgi:hypothetical protein